MASACIWLVRAASTSEGGVFRPPVLISFQRTILPHLVKQLLLLTSIVLKQDIWVWS